MKKVNFNVPHKNDNLVNFRTFNAVLKSHILPGNMDTDYVYVEHNGKYKSVHKNQSVRELFDIKRKFFSSPLLPGDLTVFLVKKKGTFGIVKKAEVENAVRIIPMSLVHDITVSYSIDHNKGLEICKKLSKSKDKLFTDKTIKKELEKDIANYFDSKLVDFEKRHKNETINFKMINQQFTYTFDKKEMNDIVNSEFYNIENVSHRFNPTDNEIEIKGQLDSNALTKEIHNK